MCSVFYVKHFELHCGFFLLDWTRNELFHHKRQMKVNRKVREVSVKHNMYNVSLISNKSDNTCVGEA